MICRRQGVETLFGDVVVHAIRLAITRSRLPSVLPGLLPRWLAGFPPSPVRAQSPQFPSNKPRALNSLVGGPQPTRQRRRKRRFAVRHDDHPRRCTGLPQPVADAVEPPPRVALVPAGRADDLSRAASSLGVSLNST